MRSLSIGDLAGQLLLRHQTAAARIRLDALTQEMASGRHADIAARVSGDLRSVSGLTSRLRHLEGSAQNVTVLTAQASQTQSALAAISDIGSSQLQDMRQATEMRQPTLVALAAEKAMQQLGAIIGILNTRPGGQGLFSGQAQDGPAVTSAEQMMSLIEARLPAPPLTASDIHDTVASWFDDPGGFTAQAYVGGPPRQPISLDSFRQIALDVTADAGPIKALLSGLSMAALIQRGALADDDTGQGALMVMAGDVMSSSSDAMINMQARLGIQESLLAEAQTANMTEGTLLQQTLLSMISPDPEDTAAYLEQARQQLDMIYAITIRLSGLSLLEAMR